MGQRHFKYKKMEVRLYDIKKYDHYILLRCQPYDLILFYHNKNYNTICQRCKIGYQLMVSYYQCEDLYIIHNIL